MARKKLYTSEKVKGRWVVIYHHRHGKRAQRTGQVPVACGAGSGIPDGHQR